MCCLSLRLRQSSQISVTYFSCVSYSRSFWHKLLKNLNLLPDIGLLWMRNVIPSWDLICHMAWFLSYFQILVWEVRNIDYRCRSETATKQMKRRIRSLAELCFGKVGTWIEKKRIGDRESFLARGLSWFF